MLDAIKPLLESGLIDEEVGSELNEAWELKLTEGGPTRFDSVKNGLKQVDPDMLVGIHDAVRPLVSLGYGPFQVTDCADPPGIQIGADQTSLSATL